MYKYLEIKPYGSGDVAKRVDVTGKSERQVDKIDAGINRNLNHAAYFTVVHVYDDPQPII